MAAVLPRGGRADCSSSTPHIAAATHRTLQQQHSAQRTAAAEETRLEHGGVRGTGVGGLSAALLVLRRGGQRRGGQRIGGRGGCTRGAVLAGQAGAAVLLLAALGHLGDHGGAQADDVRLGIRWARAAALGGRHGCQRHCVILHQGTGQNEQESSPRGAVSSHALHHHAPMHHVLNGKRSERSECCR